jgi:hypothetical protein
MEGAEVTIWNGGVPYWPLPDKVIPARAEDILRMPGPRVNREMRNRRARQESFKVGKRQKAR